MCVRPREVSSVACQVWFVPPGLQVGSAVSVPREVLRGSLLWELKEDPAVLSRPSRGKESPFPHTRQGQKARCRQWSPEPREAESHKKRSGCWRSEASWLFFSVTEVKACRFQIFCTSVSTAYLLTKRIFLVGLLPTGHCPQPPSPPSQAECTEHEFTFTGSFQ